MTKKPNSNYRYYSTSLSLHHVFSFYFRKRITKRSKLSDDLALFSLIILRSISYDKYLNTAELVVAN